MRAALQTFFDADWGWLALIALLVILITCLIVALFAALDRAPGQTLMSMGTAIATALGSAFVFSVLVILFSEYFKAIASFKFIVPVVYFYRDRRLLNAAVTLCFRHHGEEARHRDGGARSAGRIHEGIPGARAHRARRRFRLLH